MEFRLTKQLKDDIERCAIQIRQEARDRTIEFDEDEIEINKEIKLANRILKAIKSDQLEETDK